MKKLCAVVLVLSIVCSMSLNSFAEKSNASGDTGSIFNVISRIYTYAPLYLEDSILEPDYIDYLGKEFVYCNGYRIYFDIDTLNVTEISCLLTDTSGELREDCAAFGAVAIMAAEQTLFSNDLARKFLNSDSNELKSFGASMDGFNNALDTFSELIDKLKQSPYATVNFNNISCQIDMDSNGVMQLHVIPLDGNAHQQPSSTKVPSTPSTEEEPPKAYRELKSGDSGDDVYALKHRLSEIGYLNEDSFNDFYGAVLAERVKVFQADYGMEVTGVATPEMQELCFSTNVVSRTPLSYGDSGETVKALQKSLSALGYLDDKYIDGYYNEPTESAIAEFQYQNGLKVTKTADIKTQRLCLSGEAAEYDPSRAIPTASPTPDPTPTPLPTSTPSPIPYQQLQKGDKGEEVQALKERLYKLGYFNTNKLNDSYSDSTAEAIKNFQKANGLNETGIANPETLAKLYSNSAKGKPTPTPRPTRKPTPTPKPTKIPYKKISYKDLARDIDGYKGAYVKFIGAKVLQFFDSDTSKYDAYALIYVDRYAEQLMYIYIPGFKSWEWTDGGKVSRLLEDDKIDIEATVVGSYTYTTVRGDERTVPYLSVDNMWLYD